jgi:hypothetical protein
MSNEFMKSIVTLTCQFGGGWLGKQCACKEADAICKHVVPKLYGVLVGKIRLGIK